MASQDALNAGKTALMFYMSYFNAVSQVIGVEKATELQAKVSENMGMMQGKMMKEQSGMADIDAKTAWSMLRNIPESFGSSIEVVEESPQKVTLKCGKCSVYEAAHTLGIDDKTIETMCNYSSNITLNSAARQLNPNLDLKVAKFRSRPDEPCMEELVLSST